MLNEGIHGMEKRCCIPSTPDLKLTWLQPKSMQSDMKKTMAVTPVRTGPFPTVSLPSPAINVVTPTSTPGTSVMALLGPVGPSNGTPRSRARSTDCAPNDDAEGRRKNRRIEMKLTER